MIKNVSSLIEELLVKREFSTESTKMDSFINPSYKNFRNPFDFENMKKIVEKIISIQKEKGKIFIYGDYDVDGISGTAFLVKFFREIGIDCDYYIPNRSEPDYGVSKDNIDYFKKKNAKLIITVDTGYNSKDDVRYARDLGIDIIVTDHHKTQKEAGDEEILYLNPKLSDKYAFKYLSGAGVAFKLAQGLCIELNINMEVAYQYLDIIMIGTIADVVPMIDENRIIIKKGLELLKNTKVKGLTYLRNYLRLDKKDITTTDVSYYISPLINSFGRVGISKMGVDFFIKDDDFDLYNIIEEMKVLNKERRNLERFIYDDAIKKINNIKKREKMNLIFLYSDKWHPGVIGVVSSRLSIKFKIPVILIAFDGEYGKASCRSVNGISIFNHLEKVKDLLYRYGGHDLAAGFVVHKSKVTLLKNILLESIPLQANNKIIQKDEKFEMLTYDFALPLEEIDQDVFDLMDKMRPFGMANPHPLFYDDGIKLKHIKFFGIDSRHFSATIYKKGIEFEAVGFDMTNKIKDSKFDKFFRIVFYPEKNILRDKELIQIIIKDIK